MRALLRLAVIAMTLAGCAGGGGAPVVCEEELDRNDPFSYARAIGVCEGVTSAVWNGPSDSRARNIVANFGSVYLPREGSRMIVLSSGIAADADEPEYVAPEIGTILGAENTAPHPSPSAVPVGCGAADPDQVMDYTELSMVLTAPTSAHSFSFDFNFLSAEYPEFVCGSYEDTFVAVLESEAFTGNIAFDALGVPISVNVGFFSVCEPGTEPEEYPGFCVEAYGLAGTGYELSGGTGWLTTTAPVSPGETISLRFAIFDEGDHITDSAVMIDNFRWNHDTAADPHTQP